MAKFQQILPEITKILSADRVFSDEPLTKHNSFKIGGSADILCMPASEEELAALVALCRDAETPYFLLGHGTNILFPDEGLRGAVIKLYPHFGECTVEETRLSAQAGALLSAAANKALQNSLAGMEFAAGIPGTVGGAVCMNAGAYGPEIKDICESVRMLMPDGQIKTFTAEEMQFGYRHSIAAESGGIILSAVFALQPGDAFPIKFKTSDLNTRRFESQPLEMPSAGSVFKRPTGGYAGHMVEQCGLKGYTIGGAQVSAKHAGFIVNTGNATAADVRALIEHIQTEVQKKFGVLLELEVKVL